jgi:hypothetical protein
MIRAEPIHLENGDVIHYGQILCQEYLYLFDYVPVEKMFKRFSPEKRTRKE